MNTPKIFKITLAAFLLASAIITFSGCKKKATGPAVANNTQGGKYYLTGDVNGATFKANLVAAEDTAGMIWAFGVQIVGQDTTVIVIVFPDNIALNQAVTYNAAELTILAYANSIHPAKADVFVTALTNNVPNGNLTVTSIDRQNQTVSGIFTAVATEQSGGAVTITNGKFYMPIIAGQSPGWTNGLKY